MSHYQLPPRPARCGTLTEGAAWDAIHGLLGQVAAQRLPDAVKRAAALALALLDGGERATAEELRVAARKRDEPLDAADARAVRARAERVFAERFGSRGSWPDAEPETRGFGLVTPHGEIAAVVFSQGDALRISRTTDHRVVRVLVREVPPPAASAVAEAVASARHELAAELRAVPPGSSLSLPLPDAPVERRARQGQIANLAGRLWGKDRVRAMTCGASFIVTRIDGPASRAAGAPNRAA